MTALRAFFPPAFVAVIGLPVLILTGASSGWIGIALGLGLLVLGNLIVWRA